MKQEKKTKYAPPVVAIMLLELEQSLAAESATVQPVNPTDTSNQPEVTDWKAGGTTDQTFTY